MAKPKVEFVNLSGIKKEGKEYILIATNSKGEKISFRVDGIK